MAECNPNRWADPIWMAEMNAMRDEFIAPTDWQPEQSVCSPPQRSFEDSWAEGPMNCSPPRRPRAATPSQWENRWTDPAFLRAVRPAFSPAALASPNRWTDPNYVEAVRSAFPPNAQEAAEIMFQDQGYQIPDLLDLDPCAPHASPLPSTPSPPRYPGIADVQYRTPVPIPEELLRWTPEAGTPYSTPPNCYNMQGFVMPLSGPAALQPDPMAMRDLLRTEMLDQPGSARDRAKRQREEYVNYHKAKAAYGQRKAGARRQLCASDGVMAVKVQQAIENAIQDSNLPAHVRKSPAKTPSIASTSSSEVVRKLQSNIQCVVGSLVDLSSPPRSFFAGLQPASPYSPPRSPVDLESWPADVEQAVEAAIQGVNLEKHISKRTPPRSGQICIRSPVNTPSTPSTSTSSDEVIIRLQRKLQANLQQILRKHGLPSRQRRDDMEDMEAVSYLMEEEGFGYEPKPHPSHWQYAPRGQIIPPPGYQYEGEEEDCDDDDDVYQNEDGWEQYDPGQYDESCVYQNEDGWAEYDPAMY